MGRHYLGDEAKRRAKGTVIRLVPDMLDLIDQAQRLLFELQPRARALSVPALFEYALRYFVEDATVRVAEQKMQRHAEALRREEAMKGKVTAPPASPRRAPTPEELERQEQARREALEKAWRDEDEWRTKHGDQIDGE